MAPNFRDANNWTLTKDGRIVRNRTGDSYLDVARAGLPIEMFCSEDIQATVTWNVAPSPKENTNNLARESLCGHREVTGKKKPKSEKQKSKEARSKRQLGYRNKDFTRGLTTQWVEEYELERNDLEECDYQDYYVGHVLRLIDKCDFHDDGLYDSDAYYWCPSFEGEQNPYVYSRCMECFWCTGVPSIKTEDVPCGWCYGCTGKRRAVFVPTGIMYEELVHSR